MSTPAPAPATSPGTPPATPSRKRRKRAVAMTAVLLACAVVGIAWGAYW